MLGIQSMSIPNMFLHVLHMFACSIPMYQDGSHGWAADFYAVNRPCIEHGRRKIQRGRGGGPCRGRKGCLKSVRWGENVGCENATCFGTGGRTMEESELCETSWVLKLVSQLMSVLLGWFCDDGPESWAFHSELQRTKPSKTSVGAQILCNRSWFPFQTCHSHPQPICAATCFMHPSHCFSSCLCLWIGWGWKVKILDPKPMQIPNLHIFALWK